VVGPGEDTQPFNFSVRRVEYLGSDRYVYGSVAESGTTPATIIAKLPATIGLAIPEGETHAFAVPRRTLRYFDAETGLRRSV
jgi:multiple sugar transport system ATP-binding protein